MKRAAIFLIILLVCTAVWAQQKHALVIGNGNYTGQPWGNLRNAVNDAADMKAALESLGFQVDYISNGNLSQMQTAVINLKQRLRSSPSSYGFFYYAGHGAQDRNNQNYLIPADADTPSLNLLPQRALPVQFVMDELEEAKNVLNMIVLDACRDVPVSLDRSGNRGLSVISQIPRGSIVMYATAANKTAGDGTGRNGLFTSHLLRNLTTPGLTVSEVFVRTGADVARATNGEQYPEFRQMYYETAYLGTRPAVNPTPQPAPAPAPVPVQPVAPPQRTALVDMVRINGGTFLMGSPANEPESENKEGPQHWVTVSSFYMGKYPVTQREYQAVMGTNPSRFKGDNLPVENVSWYVTLVFCNRLSMREGLSPAYRINGSTDPAAWGGVPTDNNATWNAVQIVAGSNGYRLPTEAQWEYACRAGTTTPFSTGNNITTSQANYNGIPYNKNAIGEDRQRTTPVGSFTPNPWGLYDMHGNVGEWCWDREGDYSSGAQTDPIGAQADRTTSASFRVIRGGSWNDYGRYLRSASRKDYMSYAAQSSGFRLVRP